MVFLGVFPSMAALVAKGNPGTTDLVWAIVTNPAGIEQPAVWNAQDTTPGDQSAIFPAPPNTAIGRWSLVPFVGGPLFPAGVAVNKYLTQAAWFVDSVNGSDTNDGLTAGTALATFGEIVRRWGPNPVLRQTTTVTIAATGLALGDPIRFQNVMADRFDHRLIIRGTMGNGAALGNAGLLAAASAINRAGNLAQTVTITGQAWAGFLGTFVRIVGGARAGATACPVKDLTAGQARNSPFNTIPVGGGILSLSQVTPQAGDTLQQVVPSTCLSPLNLQNNQIEIRFENLEFFDDAGSGGQQIRGNEQITFNFCKLHGFITSQNNFRVAFQVCIFPADALVACTSATYLLGCACIGTGDTELLVGGSFGVDDDTIFEGAWCASNEFPTGLAPSIGNVGFFDLTSALRPAILVNQGYLAVGPFFNGTGIVYGSSIAGFTAQTENGSTIVYAATSNFAAAGATAVFNYSGVNKNVGDLPLPIDAHNNAIVLAA